MGTMWYHDNFKNLYRSTLTYVDKGTGSNYNYYPVIYTNFDTISHFKDTLSTSYRYIIPANSYATSSASSGTVTALASDVLLSIICFKYGDCAAGATQPLNNCFKVGYYTGSWDGQNALSGTKSNISVSAVGLNYVQSYTTPAISWSGARPVITFTNNSSSGQEINYIAYQLYGAQCSTTNLSSSYVTGRILLMWVYQLDSSITIPPLGTVSIAFDSFLPPT